jgi:hypothetical protein
VTHQRAGWTHCEVCAAVLTVTAAAALAPGGSSTRVGFTTRLAGFGLRTLTLVVP